MRSYNPIIPIFYIFVIIYFGLAEDLCNKGNKLLILILKGQVYNLCFWSFPISYKMLFLYSISLIYNIFYFWTLITSNTHYLLSDHHISHLSFLTPLIKCHMDYCSSNFLLYITLLKKKDHPYLILGVINYFIWAVFIITTQ